MHEQKKTINRAAAFGALACLLAEAVMGEYSADVEGRKAIITLQIPVWAKLSDQSRKSLEKLDEYSAAHETRRDSIYETHVYTVPLDGGEA